MTLMVLPPSPSRHLLRPFRISLPLRPPLPATTLLPMTHLHPCALRRLAMSMARPLTVVATLFPTPHSPPLPHPMTLTPLHTPAVCPYILPRPSPPASPLALPPPSHRSTPWLTVLHVTWVVLWVHLRMLLSLQVKPTTRPSGWHARQLQPLMALASSHSMSRTMVQVSFALCPALMLDYPSNPLWTTLSRPSAFTPRVVPTWRDAWHSFRTPLLPVERMLPSMRQQRLCVEDKSLPVVSPPPAQA